MANSYPNLKKSGWNLGRRKGGHASSAPVAHTVGRGERMARKRKDREDGVMNAVAELFDLPADVVAGVPRLELVGTGELRMEHHKGILAYGTEEIHISGGSYISR